MKALLVDDDRDLVDLLNFTLRRVGFSLLTAYDGSAALRVFEEEQPDIVVLDVNLPNMGGLDVLRAIRRRSDTPVILLTGRGAEDDKVQGLELGADDYVTKPFSHRELIARMGAQLRRHGREWVAPKAADALIESGPVRLNTREHSAALDGKPLALTVTEFRVLHYLMTNAGVVVPASALLRQVWGYDSTHGGQDVDVVRIAIHRLRRKLGDSSSSPRLVHTIPGVGVMFKPADAETAADAAEAAQAGA